MQTVSWRCLSGTLSDYSDPLRSCSASLPPLVVALLETDDSAFIYDLDTRLEPFPCQAFEYVARAFRPDMPIKEEYRQ